MEVSRVKLTLPIKVMCLVAHVEECRSFLIWLICKKIETLIFLQNENYTGVISLSNYINPPIKGFFGLNFPNPLEFAV